MKYDKDKFIGKMIFDFYEGPKSLSNKWIPSTGLTADDIKEVTQKVNNIMFDRFNNYDKIVDECGGQGYDREKLIEEETDNFYYATKLIPVRLVVNGYIFVYRK